MESLFGFVSNLTHTHTFPNDYLFGPAIPLVSISEGSTSGMILHWLLALIFKLNFFWLWGRGSIPIKEAWMCVLTDLSLTTGRYFDEISQDTGKYCFGVEDTLKALEMGAVEILIVYENLDIMRYVLHCQGTEGMRIRK